MSFGDWVLAGLGAKIGVFLSDLAIFGALMTVLGILFGCYVAWWTFFKKP